MSVVRDPLTQQHLREFGERVRLLRVARRLSQEQLAEAAGLHRTVVGFIERGERDVGVSTVWLLAGALSVLPPVLFEEEHGPTSGDEPDHRHT